MKICYFGSYDPEYARSRVLKKGLQENHIDVVERCIEGGTWREFMLATLSLWRERGDYDAVLVGHSRAKITVLLAKLAYSGPVVWDAFLSLYDSWVHDRKFVSSWHPKSWYYWFLDWQAGKLANHILLDTNNHISYFETTFGLSSSKMTRIFIGSDNSVFSPTLIQKNKVKDRFLSKYPYMKNKTVIGFHGKYIPLQGVTYIIKAAKKLENDSNIQFVLIGAGQTYKKVRRLEERLNPGNIIFIDRVPFTEIPHWIDLFDVALGIFGDTEKAQRVIPNKVYESVAMKKPVVTADTPAIRELFTPDKDIKICRHADAESLASAIRSLAEDSQTRNRIANYGFETFNEKAQPKEAVLPLVNYLGSVS